MHSSDSTGGASGPKASASGPGEAVPSSADLPHERLELAVEATELGLWEWDMLSGELFWSLRQRAIFGLSGDAPVTYESWAGALHPQDRDWVFAAVAKAIDPAGDGRLQLEHRIVLPSGAVRWIFANARCFFARAGAARTGIRLLGTVLDIDERKRAEEERRLLVRELNHRVKNLFAVATSLVALTARSSATPLAMGEALRGRFAALGRAHELIRPALGPEGILDQGTRLHDLAAAVLEPYGGEEGERIALDGPVLPVGPQAATAMTLVLHELATNAVKYGALGEGGGRLAVAWRREGEDVVLTWRERDGPRVSCAPKAEGFGSRLARKSIEGQLGGTLALDWASQGLAVTVRVRAEALAG